MSLPKQSTAPDFTSLVHTGETLIFHEAVSKAPYTVLYFYPKDDTPGCTTQACGLRDSISEFEKLGVNVFGIGKGNKLSHIRFAKKYNLNFPLIIDTDLKVCESYGVLKEKSMFGKKYWGIERTTFIIDRDMKIVEVFENVNPLTHAGGVLEKLQNLAKAHKKGS